MIKFSIYGLKTQDNLQEIDIRLYDVLEVMEQNLAAKISPSKISLGRNLAPTNYC